MADYGYFENPKQATFEPKGPGAKVMDLLRRVEELEAQLAAEKAINALRVMESSLDHAPVVEEDKERKYKRTLTKYEVQIGSRTFSVEKSDTAFMNDRPWRVVTAGVDTNSDPIRFDAATPELVDSECEAAAKMLDELQSHRSAMYRLRQEFLKTRKSDAIFWHNFEY